jgi:hypothetical protein
MTIGLLAVVVLAVWVLPLGKAAAENAHQAFGYDDYAIVLRTYVDDQGMVNYRGLKADGRRLDAFTMAIETLDLKIYDRWTDREKIAFWINAYNALTLKAIVTHYPIQPSFFASLRFPKSSIRQIPGVWDELRFGVMGRKMTLDEIEHETLRRQFSEPRIHMALVCAAMGCPPLRSEPYLGDKLEAQLKDQTRRFLQNPLKFRIDQGGGRVHLSSIFKWFAEDFVKTYGTGEKFAGHNSTEQAVMNFVSQYLDGQERQYLATGRYHIAYLNYDWSLNEQKEG